MIYPNALPKALQDLYHVLLCAYPNGVPDEKYPAVLFILRSRSELTHRLAARVLSIVSSYDYWYIYNDALTVESDPSPDIETIAEVQHKLDACGYKNWLDNINMNNDW